MKLVYLWIESYQYIRQKGYSLNAEYNVHYDPEKKELEIERAESLDRLLYGDKISVTAIVGDNGAGKSTLLDVIRLVLFDERSRKKEIKGFLLWEDGKQLELFPFLEKPLHVTSRIPCNVSRWIPDDFDLIYYSDFFDLKYYLNDFDDGEDGYTYIEEEQKSFRNRDYFQFNISSSHLLREASNRIMDFFHDDIKKQIYYYGSLQEDMLPFQIPKQLSVKLEFLSIDIFDRVLDVSLKAYEYRGMGHKRERNTNAHVIGLLKTMERVYERKIILSMEPLDVDQILQWDIWVTFLYNLLAYRKGEHEAVDDYMWVDNILAATMKEDVSEEVFFHELGVLFEDRETKSDDFRLYLDTYHRMKDLLAVPKKGAFQVKFTIPHYMMNFLWEGNPFAYFELDPKEYNPFDIENMDRSFAEKYMEKLGWSGAWDFNTFLRLFDSYTELSYEIDFLKFSWGLSTGESNLFNLFARLYHVMKRGSKKKILLLFDELDSSFHPQWQQKIMKALTIFLRDKYPEKEFQIIFTTHSPVLLSDIPRENVVFLRKEQEQVLQHEQTFAANIASLYYDSFFMEKGSIGEVAQGSMTNLLDAIAELEEEERQKGMLEGDRGFRLVQSFLEKQYPEKQAIYPENSERILELIQKLINNIGEDIWRYKVNESFHQFMKRDVTNVKKELWNRLKELERKEGRAFVEALLQKWQREEEV